jgi:hypothetical protein
VYVRVEAEVIRVLIGAATYLLIAMVISVLTAPSEWTDDFMMAVLIVMLTGMLITALVYTAEPRKKAS